MGKKAMKEALAVGTEFEGTDMSLVDTDRGRMKSEGGEYVDGNVVLRTPVEHMERHGILRIRPEHLEELKGMFDDRAQIMKLHLKINNQLLAYERRTDHLSEHTVEMLQFEAARYDTFTEERSKPLKKAVRQFAKEDALMASALGVFGVGEITVAALTVYVDLEKAEHPSSLWAYAGYDKPSHGRYTKGQASGGNKTLRTVLYNTACCFWRDGRSYREIGDRTKERLANSEKLVMSRNTQGKLVEVMWKDTKPCHRHGAALRAMIKYFLADYWFVGRTLRELPTTDLYVKEHLGHASAIINPRERGWVY